MWSLVLFLSDRGREQLGRECYPGGNCVASELGRKHTVGQIKMSALSLLLLLTRCGWMFFPSIMDFIFFRISKIPFIYLSLVLI